MHARMTHSLTTRHGPHDSDTLRTGGGKAVELTYNGFLWLDKPWPVAVDGGACRSAMVCFISPRVSPESDRKIDLSQRVFSTCCEWLVLRVSEASQAQCGRSPASETDRSSTVADVVASVCSAAGFLRNLRSRQKVSFF